MARMKARAALLLLGLHAAACVSAQPLPAPEDLFRQLTPSVWIVRTYDAKGEPHAYGSAVVVAPETLVTNCHVLEGGRRFTIQNDNVGHNALLQYQDPERDLCQITARGMTAPAVTLGDSDALVVGQKVYALGNPRGLERTFSDGLISALHRKEPSRELVRIQTSAPVSQGSSGGGLFDTRGRLIGITSATRRDGQNLNFAIPINWLQELPQRHAARSAAATAPTPAPAVPAPAAPPSGARNVADVDAVPVNEACKGQYRRFLGARHPRAFAITASGQCAWADGVGSPRPELSKARDPSTRALEYCERSHGGGCALYAVDDRVVWSR